METLEHFVLNKNLPTYDYGEYLDCLHKEVARDARAEGLAEGRAEGLAKGKAEGLDEAALKMLESGMEINTISSILGIDISKLKTLIEK